jgi:hypothetical protein
LSNKIAAHSSALDAMLADVIDDPQKISIADKLARVADFVQLAIGLRTWAASRVEKLRVQLDGEKAAFPADVAASCSATDIVNILDAAERAVCDKYNVPPITGAVAPVTPPKRLDTTTRVFKLS